jgi:hypothetical protein
MGLELPQPTFPYGTDCTYCTPPHGSLWPVGQTPLHIYAFVAGILRCPLGTYQPPNNHIFKLTQEEFEPCSWRWTGPKWHVHYTPATGIGLGSHFDLADHNGKLHFWHDGNNCPPENSVFLNDLLDCLGSQHARLGFVIIFWTDAALKIAEALNFSFDENLFLEQFSTGSDPIVLKFCQVPTSTNVKILCQL